MKLGKAKFAALADKSQTNWGNCDDPNKVCTVGTTYEIENIEIHSWHTKISLKGVVGQFNSSSFVLNKTADAAWEAAAAKWRKSH